MARWQDYVLRGTTAAQPAATVVSVGTLYGFTDGVKSGLVERSNGTAWEGYFGVIENGVVNHRLTTESGVPVSPSDRTAQGTIYFTPYNGNRIALYTGSDWAVVAMTELSLTLTATSGNNYDVFVDYNSGTPQLVLAAAWTNDTTRAAAGALVLQDGVYVLTGNTDHRWVGTIRASGANVTADALAQRFVWNAYNQVPRGIFKSDSTGHAYATNTVRFWNNDATQIMEYVLGTAQTFVVLCRGDATPGTDGRLQTIGVGNDSSTSINSGANPLFSAAQRTRNSVGVVVNIVSGYHYFAGLENADSGASVTFNGYNMLATILA